MLDYIEQILIPLVKGKDLKHTGALLGTRSLVLRGKVVGFGIKRVNEWNKASVVKHIVHILCNDPDSIWNRWVQST